MDPDETGVALDQRDQLRARDAVRKAAQCARAVRADADTDAVGVFLPAICANASSSKRPSGPARTGTLA
jgi:hypothetical protein